MNLESFARTRESLLKTINQVHQLSEEAGYSGISTACNRLSERVSLERFHVSVLGEIKRGKSSLVNALVGKVVLPSAATICTAVLTILRFGEVPRGVARYVDAPERPFEIDELHSLVTKKNRDASKIASIELILPERLLENGLVIIDTPGVNDTDEVRRRITEEFVPRSDGVIFVLNAGQPLSDSEVRFLTGSVMRHHIRKFWFVLNGIDRIPNPEDASKAVEYCRENLSRIVPDPKIFPVSAKTFLEALKCSATVREGDNSGISQFLATFTSDLVESRRKELLLVPARQLREILDHFSTGARLESEFLGKSSTELMKTSHEADTGIKRVEKEINRAVLRCTGEAESVVFEAVTNFPPPDEENLLKSICHILALDDTDERKTAEIGHIVADRAQFFKDQLMTTVQAKVYPALVEAQSVINKLAGELDSRFLHQKSRSIDLLILEEVNLDEPKDVFIERTLASGFGKMASLGFLLTGNLLMAAASFAASLLTRLDLTKASWVLEKTRKEINERCEKIKSDVISRKAQIAATCRSIVERNCSGAIEMAAEMGRRSRNNLQLSLEERTRRLKLLAEAESKVSQSCQKLETLLREIEPCNQNLQRFSRSP